MACNTFLSRTFRKLLVLLALTAAMVWGLSSPALAAEAIALTPELDGQTLFGLADFQLDPQAHTAPRELDPTRWKPLYLENRDHGITGDAYWLRLRLSNPGAQPQTWVLAHDYPWIGELTVYVEDATGMRNQSVRYRAPFSQRLLPSARPAVRESLAAGAEQTVYVRLRNVPADGLNLSLRLYSEPSFIQAAQKHVALQSFFIGTYAAISITWLMFALALRQGLLFAYVGLALCTALNGAGMGGMVYQFASPNTPYWYTQGLFASFAAMSFFSFLFTDLALNLKVAAPRLHRLAQALGAYCALVTLLALSGMVDLVLVNILSKLAMLSICCNALFALVAWRRQKHLQSAQLNGWLTLGWVIYGLNALILSLMVPFIALLIKIFGAQFLPVGSGINWVALSQFNALIETLCFTMSMVSWVRLQHQHRLLAEHSANNDELTGLHNRKWLIEQINKLPAQTHVPGPPRRWLAIVDIDHFKQVNDTYGHAAGDAVLRHFAKTLRDNCRSSDLFGRLGGEEFVICFDDISQTSVLQIAERLREAFHARPTLYEGHSIQHSLSLGLAPATGDDLSRWLQRADTALYAAKNGGRNRVVFAQDADTVR